MTLLYRLQQHAALTRLEIKALATLTLLFAGGLGAQAVQRDAVAPVSPALLAADGARFQRQAALADSTLAPRRDSVRAVATEAIRAEAVALPDSLRGVVERAALGYRAKKVPFTGRMNLNTASQAQLERLPRVGPKLAERILDYRRAHGGFRSVAQLNDVKGIGDKTLALLAPHLFV